MTSTESPARQSPFLSLFHRKKKVNGTKSIDDIKVHQKEKPVSPPSEKKKSKKVDSHTLPSNFERKKKGRAKTLWDVKSQSLDDLIERDPKALVEALETIASEQPIVARSIPKHAKVIKPREDRLMKNCLFEKEVYDSMLSDSLRVCDLLQSHLEDCIVSVRAKSPERCFELSTVKSEDCGDSGRGASSPSSTASSSVHSVLRKPLKSCVRADV